MIELLEDAMIDVFPMFPILFLTYIVLEYIEHKDSNSFERLKKYKRLGPLFGAFIGILPQCGFSVAAAGLFVEHTISFGTLISVFIATSDEAIPILLSYPDQYSILLWTILLKVIIAFLAGYLIDCFYHPKEVIQSSVIKECHSHSHSIWFEAFRRTLKIACFIFLVNIILNGVIDSIGEEQLSTILMNDTIFQPLLAGIFGFIPNCAATVVLTQLFITEGISFGSLIAGLITNAGLGLLVLFQSYKNKKDIIVLLSYMLIISFISGTLLQILY